MCINHRCNVQYGRCAFPCASDADCVRGTACLKAAISTCQSGAEGLSRGGGRVDQYVVVNESIFAFTAHASPRTERSTHAAIWLFAGLV